MVERQSDHYKHTENIDYVGGFPGADPEGNRIRVAIIKTPLSEDISDLTSAVEGDEDARLGVKVDPSTDTTLSTLAAEGSEALRGQVKSSGTYDLAVEWLDAPSGNVVRSESVATAAAAGTWTTFNLTAYGVYANVVVTDTSGAEQTADYTVNMS